MERREFLSGSALTMAGVSSLVTMLGSSSAKASQVLKMNIEIPDVQISNDENDYQNWAISPSTPGGQIRYKILWKSNEVGSESICKLLRFKSGVAVPRHLHPEGELTCVLAGSFIQAKSLQSNYSQDEVDRYCKGDIIWMPANSIHGAATVDGSTGVTILSFTPKNVLFKF